MPLKYGTSKSTMKGNMKKLMSEKPSTRRLKGIATIAKKEGISKPKAKVIQAYAIVKRMQRESKRK